MPNVVLKDHYVVLGLSRSATEDEIKKAYRRKLMKIHPDLLGPDATEREKQEAHDLTAELTVAFEQLSDPSCRQVIDLWVGVPTHGSDPDPDIKEDTPLTAPPAGQHFLNGIWVWVEFHVTRGWYSSSLRATVTIQLADLFRTDTLGDMPHGAWLEEVIAVDEKGDVVGRAYSLASLRYDIRRLQAEAKRNEDRRVWRLRLAAIQAELERLTAEQKPVGQLRKLMAEANRCVESGVNSLRHAEQHDTVVRAIREAEKEVERIKYSDTSALLLTDLLSGKIAHPDLKYNQALLIRLHIYQFRSGGDYRAPTAEEVEAHYRRRIAGLTTQDQVLRTNLRLEDDEPTILELVRDGALDLAPDSVQVQGNKGLVSYPVEYGYAKVNGERTAVGIIVIPESAYERNAGQYGRTSKLPALPYGITLLIRVRVKVQNNETLTRPCPDGKSLQNEVARCRARLRNPREPESTELTAMFLEPWPFY